VDSVESVTTVRLEETFEGMSVMPSGLFPHASKPGSNTDEDSPRQLPKGVVLDKDGKPYVTNPSCILRAALVVLGMILTAM
jgi:hypothetical protein